MSDFPENPEEFYRLRDDRTNRCTTDRTYQTVSCAVFLHPAVATSLRAQVMLVTSANLLSRWCRNVTIAMPSIAPHQLLGMHGGDLGSQILEQMRDADPFGDFQITSSDSPTEAVNLYIGYSEIRSAPLASVFIDAAGWLAALSSRPISLPAIENANTLGAIAASCFGVAQMFKIAIRAEPARYFREGYFNLFRLEWNANTANTPWPRNLNIGKILMIGAGSVGSSAAYCMRMSGLAGQLTIVDGDRVKIENFNRSPVFGRRTLGALKAEAVARLLSGSAMNASAEPLWWDGFFGGRSRKGIDFDIWLPLANEFGVRHSIQHNVPPLLIHASTTANWGVNHGRHVPGRDDCLADRFPVEMSIDDLGCSTGQVKMPQQTIDAALPFASLFAGLLITADLARTQLPEYPQVANFALFDWFGPMDAIQAWDRQPRVGCICRQQGLTLHKIFNGGTKYWPLFRLV